MDRESFRLNHGRRVCGGLGQGGARRLNDRLGDLGLDPVDGSPSGGFARAPRPPLVRVQPDHTRVVGSFEEADDCPADRGWRVLGDGDRSLPSCPDCEPGRRQFSQRSITGGSVRSSVACLVRPPFAAGEFVSLVAMLVDSGCLAEMNRVERGVNRGIRGSSRP